MSLRDWGCLFLVLAWGLWLRGGLVGVESPWYDEVISLMYLDAGSLGAFLEAVRGDNSPTQPLYFVLEYTWALLFGNGYEAQRWLCVLLGELSLILVYLIGYRIQGTTTACLATLALASSAAHLEYSLEIRMYMLAFVWVMLSVYSLMRVLDGGGKVWWTIHFLSTVGLVWSHAFGAFILPVEGLAFLIWGTRSWQSRAAWFGGQTLAAGTLVLWLLNSTGSAIDDEMSWLPLPTLWLNDTSLWVSLVGTWYTWLVSSYYHTGLSDPRNAIPFVVYGGLAISAFACAAIRSRKRNEADDFSYGTILWLAGWWVIPSLLLYGLSHLWQPAFFPRYVLYSVVPPFFMSAWLVSRIPAQRWRNTAIGAMVALALAMGYFNTRQPYRAPWHWVVEEVAVVEGVELMLFSQQSSGNDIASSVVSYLDGEQEIKVLTLTNSDALSAYVLNHNYANPAYVVLVASDPQEGFRQFISSSGLQATIYHLPARSPLTLYTISRIPR